MLLYPACIVLLIIFFGSIENVPCSFIYSAIAFSPLLFCVALKSSSKSYFAIQFFPHFFTSFLFKIINNDITKINVIIINIVTINSIPVLIEIITSALLISSSSSTLLPGVESQSSIDKSLVAFPISATFITVPVLLLVIVLVRISFSSFSCPALIFSFAKVILCNAPSVEINQSLFISELNFKSLGI